MMEFSMSDRAVVVIGGTAGLGLSGSRALLAAGASLVVVGREDEHLASAADTLAALAPDRVRVLAGDAADSSCAAQAVAACVEAFGKLNGLYHVAGGSGRRMGDGPLHEVTDEGVAFTLKLNLESVIWSNRAAVRQFLVQGGGGAVVNIGSVLARSPSPEFFSTHVYASAKAGIEGLTRAAAARYASDNIRFNVLAPGLVETPMARRACEDEMIRTFIRGKQPLDGGRVGRPDDLDAAVVLLLSDAGAWITGQVLAVDGGWSFSEGGSR